MPPARWLDWTPSCNKRLRRQQLRAQPKGSLPRSASPTKGARRNWKHRPSAPHLTRVCPTLAKSTLAELRPDSADFHRISTDLRHAFGQTLPGIYDSCKFERVPPSWAFGLWVRGGAVGKLTPLISCMTRPPYYGRWARPLRSSLRDIDRAASLNARSGRRPSQADLGHICEDTCRIRSGSGKNRRCLAKLAKKHRPESATCGPNSARVRQKSAKFGPESTHLGRIKHKLARCRPTVSQA